MSTMKERIAKKLSEKGWNTPDTDDVTVICEAECRRIWEECKEAGVEAIKADSRKRYDTITCNALDACTVIRALPYPEKTPLSPFGCECWERCGNGDTDWRHKTLNKWEYVELEQLFCQWCGAASKGCARLEAAIKAWEAIK